MAHQSGLRVSLAAPLSPHNQNDQNYPSLETAGAGLTPAGQRPQPQRQRERTAPKAQGARWRGQAPSPAAPPTDLMPASSCCVCSSKALPCWALFYSVKISLTIKQNETHKPNLKTSGTTRPAQWITSPPMGQALQLIASAACFLRT